MHIHTHYNKTLSSQPLQKNPIKHKTLKNNLNLTLRELAIITVHM